MNEKQLQEISEWTTAGKNQIIVDVLKDLQENINRVAEEHGFNDDWNIAQTAAQRNLINGMKIALVHSELSEALEAIRRNIMKDDHLPEFTGAEAELADAVIRILHIAEQNKLRLGEAILAKMAYNASRPFRHGGKLFCLNPSI